MEHTIREYDLIVILSPDLGLETAKEELETILKELNIKINSLKILGGKELNYERKKHKTGIYIECNLSIDKNLANELIFRLNIHNHVLQYFLKNLQKK